MVDFKTGATVPSRAAVERERPAGRVPAGHRAGCRAGRLAAGADAGRRCRSRCRSDDADPELDGGAADRGAEAVAGATALRRCRVGVPAVRHAERPPPAAAGRRGAQAWQALFGRPPNGSASSVSMAQENRYCERCPGANQLPAADRGPAGDPMITATAGRRSGPAGADRRAGRGHRGAAGARPGGRRRGLGEDRDDGRPGGLSGRDRSGPAGTGARSDLHPQGRRGARQRIRTPAADARRRLGPASACRATSRSATRRSAPTTPSAAG